MRHFCESCHSNFEASQWSKPRCPRCGYDGDLIVPNPVRQFDGAVEGGANIAQNDGRDDA